MQRHLLAALGLALAMPSMAEAQSRLDFTLVNRTGYEINEVYVGPTSSSSWGRDIMGQGTLEEPRSEAPAPRRPHGRTACLLPTHMKPRPSWPSARPWRTRACRS